MENNPETIFKHNLVVGKMQSFLEKFEQSRFNFGPFSLLQM